MAFLLSHSLHVVLYVVLHAVLHVVLHVVLPARQSRCMRSVQRGWPQRLQMRRRLRQQHQWSHDVVYVRSLPAVRLLRRCLR